MGLPGPYSRSCFTNTNTAAPNPSCFKVLQYYEPEEGGGILVVRVNYPSCTNYEGDKIMVFSNLKKYELDELKSLDPHFRENDKYSPIARFEPTMIGWRLACLLADTLANKFLLEKL